MQIEVVMPKCGLTMVEGKVVRWVRNEGDVVAEGDPLVEIETEKANMEVPAPSAGVIVHLVADVGTVIPVGGTLAILEGSDSRGATASTTAVPRRMVQAGRDDSTRALDGRGQKDDREQRASPLARRVARELHVDIGGVSGTGPKGLVTEADVQAAAATRDANVIVGPLRPARIETLTGMRKAVAAVMTRSIAEAAQVTVTREVGMTGALTVREERPKDVTLTDVMLAVVAHTLKRHLRLNAHLVGDELRIFDTVNIGLAVALDDGLVTPVIRDVSGLSLEQIVIQRRQIVDKARGRRLHQLDLEGGTFTITNLGVYGIDTFTPILNPPQVAILGIGAVKVRPAVVERAVVMRETCPLSLTFDHRALDGAPAARFLDDLATLLDNPSRLKEDIC